MKTFLSFWSVGLAVLALTSCMGAADYEAEYAEEAPMSVARSEKSAPAAAAAAAAVVGLVFLVVGARLMVEGAVRIARDFGI
ncbi:MAG: hypothetical protein P1P77_15540, partial [Spirochaetaceae bacterium]|nr:hypothetical protein [Spirochaetaceae bacterium]